MGNELPVTVQEIMFGDILNQNGREGRASMRPAIDTEERPFVLIWELTQACDLSCDHCRADAQPAAHPHELTTAEGKKLLEEMRAFGDDQLVVFSGGDPLKRPDLVELVSYGTDIGLNVTLTPSGTVSLTEARLATLQDAGLKRIALSLDGATASTHDAFRGEVGSFDDTIAAAEDASSLGIPLQINTTVCNETLGALPPIRNRIEQLGTVLWSVFFLVPVGRGANLAPISPQMAERVMEWLYEVDLGSSMGVKTTEAPHYRRVALEQGEMDAPGAGGTLGIIAGDGFAFVSHTGNIYPSGFLPLTAGNVREDELLDVYRNADLFERLRDRDELKGKCGACPFRTVCGGSRSRAYAATGNPLESDPLCAYIPPGYQGPLPTSLQQQS